MRKLALVFSALGFIAFAGVARADQKTENTEKTDTSSTLTGKKKTTHTKKIERADGSSVESTTETVRPKNEMKRDEDTKTVRHDDNGTVRDSNSGTEVKTEEHTTLGGKKQTKTMKKVDNADGSHTETTTTTTEPKRNDK